MFATEIRAAPGSYPVDYRMDLERATFTPADLPAETAQGLRALMDRLGLVYGAADLRRTEDGDVFLEVNPAGEWRFVEDRTSHRITDAMASLLASLDRP
jgi:glutathione synthase/RimK-type ligase-like ATP-grasp enzyme